jgi:hypothetical protein
MCCCGTPTINGQPGYRWQPNDRPMVRPVDPPDVQDGEEILFDEPGRCGELDCHAHHFRVTSWYGGILYLLVRNGSGDTRIQICGGKKTSLINTLAALDTHARYWLLFAMFDAHRRGGQEAYEKTNSYWRQAAAEKRIKTRKNSRRGTVKVWIEPAAA